MILEPPLWAEGAWVDDTWADDTWSTEVVQPITPVADVTVVVQARPRTVVVAADPVTVVVP